MTLEIRPAAAPQSFDLFEGEEKIGEIAYVPPEDEFPEAWEVHMWNVANSNHTWGDSVGTYEECVELAGFYYQELVAKQRESAGPSIRAISTPMGGQKRK